MTRKVWSFIDTVQTVASMSVVPRDKFQYNLQLIVYVAILCSLLNAHLIRGNTFTHENGKFDYDLLIDPLLPNNNWISQSIKSGQINYVLTNHQNLTQIICN